MIRFVRYLLALLWHWSVPFMLGYALALVTSTWVQVELFKGLDVYFAELLAPLVASCKP